MSSMFQLFWAGDVLEEARGYHRRNEKTKINNNVIFTIDNKYIELLDSFIDEDPNVEFTSNIGGIAKTLSMTCQFKISNMKILGKIFILDDFNSISSEYQLHIKNADLLIAIAFNIVYDGYEIAYIHRKVDNADLSLTYNCGSEEISLIDNSQDIRYKNLISYILNHCTKEVCIATQCAVLKTIEDGASVSDSVGHDYSLRNQYRIHGKKLKVAFNNFVNKIVDITNQLIKNAASNIIIPKIFGVLNSKENKRKVEKFKGCLMNLNSLKRSNDLVVLPENDLVILYSSINFDNLCIEFTDGNISKEEYFKTEDSFLKLSLKRIDVQKLDISLLQCEFRNFQSLSKSEIDFIIDYQISSFIQEKVKEYLVVALKNEELNILGTNPTNVEIEYDSDDFIGEDSTVDEL